MSNLILLKHFIRIKDSWLFCARQTLKNVEQSLDNLTERYRVLLICCLKLSIFFCLKNHLKWLINWSCSNLYLEGSYSQRHLSISLVHWLIHLHGNQTIETICRMKERMGPSKNPFRINRTEQFRPVRCIDLRVYLHHSNGHH